MENNDNMLKYETPSLEELYLCAAVQGTVQAGPSNVPELTQDEADPNSTNSESNW